MSAVPGPAGRRPRVLFLSSQIPFRESRAGGAKRLYYLAKGLESRCDLTVVSLDAAGERRLWDAGSMGPERLHVIPEVPAAGKGWMGLLHSPIDCRRELLRHKPGLEAFLGGGNFDATLYAYPLSLAVGALLGDARLGRQVFMDDDLLYEAYRQRWLGAPPGLKRLGYAWRHRQLLAYYRRRLARAECLVAISEEERRVVAAQFPGIATAVVGHGIPMDEHPLLPPAPNGPTFGFIGNFRHLPNLHAAEWLLREFLPAMAKRFPEGRLVLAGTGLPPDLASALDADPGVIRLDNVPRLEDFYGRFRFFLNPVFTGRGLRTKLVESAAFGRAILSTRLGAEGLQGMRISLAESAGGFLDRAESLLRQPEEYSSQVAVNREVCAAGFSIDSIAGKLASILTGQSGQRTAH